jgi:hypothetical protein
MDPSLDMQRLNLIYKNKLMNVCSLYDDLEEELLYFLNLNQSIYNTIFYTIDALIQDAIQSRTYYWVLSRFGGPVFQSKLEYYSKLSLQDFRTLGLEPPYAVREVFLCVLCTLRKVIEDN